jgi:general secretion pathway protein D
VHIEAQVAQVTLSGELEYGVSWFLENAATDNGLPDVSTPGLGTPSKWSTLGASIGGVSGPGLAWTLIKNDAAAVIRALDSVTDVKLLQTPSILVRNNQEATLNVGDRIPVVSTSVNPILGNSNSISQVQYLDTGTILKVRPRVTQDGVVFIEVVQEISSPSGAPDANGNRTISTSRLKTSAVSQSGDTVLLAGLITDNDTKGSRGLPGLTRLPVIGALFGTQTNNKRRTEIIILITPTVVRDQQGLRDFTDDYSRRFRAMDPLPPPGKLRPVPAQPHR